MNNNDSYVRPEYKILMHVADLSVPNKKGTNTQVNIVSWGGWSPVVDIRKWTEDEEGYKDPGKGVTMRVDEFKQLLTVDPSSFEDIFTKYEQEKIKNNRFKNNVVHNANRFNTNRNNS